MISQTVFLATVRKNFHASLLARKFVQDVGALTVANVAGAVLNIVQGVLVARWLGPESYGLVGLAMTYPSFIYALFDARSVSASMKFLSEYHARSERDRALAMCRLSYAIDIAVACFTFVVLVVTAHLVAEKIAHDSTVAGLMVLYGAALIPQALIGTSTAVLATLGRYPLIASLEIVSTLFRVVLVIGFVLAGSQVAGVIWANALAAAAAGFFYASFAWPLICRTWGSSIFGGSLKALKGARREIFKFIAYNDLTALIGTIPNQLDAMLLGYFRGPTEVGYYKLAKSMSAVVEYVIKPLNSVTYPELARLRALGHRQALIQKVRNLAIWIGLPLALAVLLGSGLIPIVLPLLVGDRYLPAVCATQLLFIASALSLAFFWMKPVYLAEGYVRQWFILGSSVTVSLALVYPFIVREWGYVGASGWILMLQFGVTMSTGLWLWTNRKTMRTVARLQR